MPPLVLPDGLKPKGLDVQAEEVTFDPPLPPSYPLQPPPPPYDKPQYGADWTGLKPFQVSPSFFVYHGLAVHPFAAHGPPRDSRAMGPPFIPAWSTCIMLLC